MQSHAKSKPNSWLCSKLCEVQQWCIPHPRDFGIASGCQLRVLQPWFHTMKAVLSHRAWEIYNGTLQGCISLQTNACGQPNPHLHGVVYAPFVPAHSARYSFFCTRIFFRSQAARAATGLVAEAVRQRCCKGSLCCDGKDATPVLYPGAAGRDAQVSWRRCCTCARQQPDELGCLARPAATYLDPEDNEAASACPFQLRVGVAAFALGGLVKGQTWPGISIGPRLSGPRPW